MTGLAGLMSLEGRRAVVTGAAGRLGGVIAGTLAELGASLVLVDKPGSDYGALLKDLESVGKSPVETMDCDLELEQDREGLIQRIRLAGSLHVLVNNAAFVGDSKLTGWSTEFERQTVATWRRALEVNLTAVFDLSKGLAGLLRESDGGNIINVASIYGSYAPDYSLYAGTAMGNPAAYAASKGGMIQLTRWLATTLAPQVRANAISPGGILRGQPDIFVKRYEERTPLGRMAREEDFIGAVAYLATDLSRYVTGQNLAVDGGWGLW